MKKAGGEADDERHEPKRKPDVGAVPQEGADHGGLPVRFL
jgi:hypothetical protein